MYVKRIGESEGANARARRRLNVTLQWSVAHTGLSVLFFLEPSLPFLESAARRLRGRERRGEKVRAGERSERENFSCAKYHADWLEVMKFWWLIKCKKIYRLRHLPLSLSFSCDLFLSLSLSLSLSLVSCSSAFWLAVFSRFPSLLFRFSPPRPPAVVGGFASWTEESGRRGRRKV